MKFFKSFTLYIVYLLFILNNSYGATLDKVSLQLHWKYQFEFAGFIMAKEKGFYKDIGLDVDIKEYKFGLNIEDEVLSGRANYGIYNSKLLESYLQDKDVRLLASFFKRSAIVIITKPYIKTISDLKNATIMSSTKKDFDLNFKYLFNLQGINTKDLKLIPHTYSIQTFIDGKCDAMTAFISDQPYKLDKLGVPYNIIDPSKYGIYNLQLELFTSAKELEKYPKRTKAFQEASIKGWKYAFSHKDETIKIIRKKYNPSLSYDFLWNEAQKTELLMLPNIYPLGSIDKKFFQKQFEMLKEENKHIHKSLDIFFNNVPEKTTKINFTKKEQKYLKEKETLTVCVKKNWLPYEDIVDGKYIGLSADFLNLYTSELGLNLNIIYAKNQIESLEQLSKKMCDIKPLLVVSTRRSIPYEVTKHYIHDHISLVTRFNQPYIQNLNNIKQTLLVAKGFKQFIRFINKEYPTLKLKEVATPQKALEMVASSEAFGYIGTSLASSYLIQKEFSSKLKIVNSFKDIKFGFGVLEDELILKNILNKMIKHTSKIQENIIHNRWIATTIEKDTDYTLFFQLFGVVIVLLIFIGYKNIIASKYNKQLEQKIQEAVEQNNRQNQKMLQQSRLAQMGEMISMIAHQWRQPLGAITARTGYLHIQLISKKQIEAKVLKKELDKINEYAQHLSSTINDFRDFFKENKDKTEITFNELIRTTISIVEQSLKNKNIDLIVELNSTHILYTYANELKQVLLNLIKNAEDILLEQNIEKPMIKVSTIENSIIISDNAGGIPEDIIDKIFDPYFSTKLEKDGTGLGLYMSKTIVEDHCGGKLSVVNDDKGAVFTVKFDNKKS